MSRNDWEKGEIVFPTAAWAGFKKAIRSGINAAIEKDILAVQRAVDVVKAANKGKRNVDWAKVLRAELDRQTEPRGLYAATSSIYELDVLEPWSLTDKGRLLVTAEGKIGALQRKKLPFVNSKTDTFHASGVSLTFDNDTRTAHWDVDRNNHACDHARETCLGQLFFSLLSKVTFTRGTGGTVWGSDEYSDDANRDHPGGSASYTKESFGPKGQQAEDARFSGLLRRRGTSRPRGR